MPSGNDAATTVLAAAKASTDRFSLCAGIVHAFGCRCAAEVGVWRGEFAARMLRDCPEIDPYYMIDPWRHLPQWNKPCNVPDAEFADVFEDAMRQTEFARKRRRVLRGRTQDVVDEIPDHAIGFAYIDGDHTLRGITTDLICMLPKMRPGGIIVGDDFSATAWQHGPGHEPSFVCPWAAYFAEANGLPFLALPHDQFCILNAPEDGYRLHDATGRCGELSVRKTLATPSQSRSRWRAALRRWLRR